MAITIVTADLTRCVLTTITAGGVEDKHQFSRPDRVMQEIVRMMEQGYEVMSASATHYTLKKDEDRQIVPDARIGYLEK